MSLTNNVLILGHGRKYKPIDIWCSPIPVEEWYNLSYTCVDNNPDVEPDILYDLQRNLTNWTFACASQYDTIIDTCGCLFSNGSRYNERFLKQTDKLLKINGVFYGRNNFIYKKQRPSLF